MEQLSLKKKIIFWSVPYLIFFGILGGVEWMVRIKEPHISSLEFFTKAKFDNKVELEHGQQIFEGDARLGWKIIPNLSLANWDFTIFSTNGQGLRYPRDVGKKEKRTIRIVALGDSVVFGFRVPTVWPERPLEFDENQKPFTVLMEEELQKLNPGKKVEVIPVAVPGYSSYQGLKWLEKDIGWLKPDLIVIHFGWNDTELHVQTDRAALSRGWFRLMQRKIIAHSQALIYLTKEKGEIQNKKAGQTPQAIIIRVSKDAYVANIRSIAALAEKHGARTLILGQVYRDAVTNVEQQNRIVEYRKSLAGATKEADIPYLEIEKLTENGYPENEALFGEAIHPNHLGHQLMAQEILEFIKKEELLQLNF